MPLTHDLLDRLDAQWRRLEPDWYPTLRPGLSDAEMDQLTEPLGLSVPPELRTWWGWHDGADGPAMLSPSLEILPLRDAVGIAEMMREVFHDDPELLGNPGYDPELQWPSRYLPVFRWGNEVLATDCEIQQAAAPLFLISAHDTRDRDELFSPSLADVVHRTVECFEAGYYTWDPTAGARGQWDTNGLARKVSPYNLL